MSNKLAPLEAPFPKEVRATLRKYPGIDGYLLKLFRMFANSPRFLEKAVPDLLDTDSPLSLRRRVLVIQRVTALHGCEYEWGVHVAIFAKAAGINEDEISLILKEELHSESWSTEDFILLKLVTELIRKGQPDEDLLGRVRNHFSKEQQLEICALCGTYSTISFAANAAELECEAFAARFSDFQ